MKFWLKNFLLFGICTFFISQEMQAQFFKKIADKVSDKVSEKIDKAIDDMGSKKADSVARANDSLNRHNASVRAAVPFDFVPGDSVLFKDDFSADSVGSFPKRWKTNASGAVTTVPGMPGKWFMLNNSATYKLNTLLSMPDSFTVEFDVLALCDKVSDMTSFYIGLSRDNSARNYIDGVGIAGLRLDYMNKDEYYTGSTDLGTYHFGDFDLANTINAPLHVSIEVNGTHMKAYLGKTRILDGEAFKPGSRKYFFISSPLRFDNGAQLLIGNVRIARR